MKMKMMETKKKKPFKNPIFRFFSFISLAAFYQSQRSISKTNQLFADISSTPENQQRTDPNSQTAAACAEKYDCHGLSGMRVLLVDVHLEGNLGDEMETTVFLKELKRCDMYVIALLSTWIPHPGRFDARSVREHALVDEIISIANPAEYFPSKDELPPVTYDAVVYSPGPQHTGAFLSFPIDIFFGGSIYPPEDPPRTWLAHFSPSLGLVATREPYTLAHIEKLEGYSNSSKLYMMGDLANVFEPAWPAVDYWKRVYKEKYENVTALVYARSSNFDQAIQVVRGDRLKLKMIEPRINTNVTGDELRVEETLFVSTSPVEDGGMWTNLKRGEKKIEGLRGDQFVMLESVEQMFALTQLATHVYTDRYHPGVIGYRFRKHVEFLECKHANPKNLGLQQLMHTFPDPAVIQKERIPLGMQKLRDALRKIRERRSQPHQKSSK